MKKLLILLVAGSLMFTTSCSNDDDNPSASVSVDCTYLKAQAGTTFKVRIEQTGADDISYTSEIIESEEVDGVLLAVAEGQDGTKSYLTCDGDKFITVVPETTTLNGNVTVENVVLTLDLGKPVGESYVALTLENDVTVQGTTFTNFNRYEGVVVETGLSMEVEGITYNDVVQFDLESHTSNSQAPGYEFHTTTTTYYFAPEVSSIKSVIYDEFSQSIISTTYLEEYSY